ncbi:7953_t:CDS:1, partial [Scutellospora calospora]
MSIHCPVLPCYICKRHGHTLNNCRYKNLEKNDIYGKPDRSGFLGCRCSYDLIQEKFDELMRENPNISKEKRFHCCECMNFYKYYQVNDKNKCKNCRIPCFICKENHMLNECKYKNYFDKNYIYGRYDENGKLGCGCSYDLIQKNFNELIEKKPNTSKERKYHCCKCYEISKCFDLIDLGDSRFNCKRCYEIFCEGLPEDDQRKLEYYQSNEYQKNIVNCVICDKEHKRGNYLEGIGNFCDIHHQIAYKVWEDIQNPNKNINDRIEHWTEIRRLASYSLNK